MSETHISSFDSFADEFLDEASIRSTIIVGSSKVDDLLQIILTKYLLPKSTKGNDSDELLEGDNPLSTFSSRIKIVYRLGIIDKSLFLILENVRKIRNLSAHQTKLDLLKSPLKELVANLLSLVSRRESYRLVLQRFWQNTELTILDEVKCSFLTLTLVLEAINQKINIKKTEDELLDISNR